MKNSERLRIRESELRSVLLPRLMGQAFHVTTKRAYAYVEAGYPRVVPLALVESVLIVDVRREVPPWRAKLEAGIKMQRVRSPRGSCKDMSRRTYRAGTASDRRYKSLRTFTVKLERDEGSCRLYGVGEPWVEVTWNGYSESARVGGSEPETLARILLGELVTRHGKRKG